MNCRSITSQAVPHVFVGIVALGGVASASAPAARRKPSSQLSIANKGTPNPVILYKGAPMLKLGPMPEVETFAFAWNSSSPVLNHEAWTAWMVANDLGYGRVYPESGYVTCEYGPEHGKLIPFIVDHWEGVRPIVDLNRLDPEYWKEFENTIRRCRERDIILHLQLYQICYFFGNRWLAESWWEKCYFHPKNNVNGHDLGGWEKRSGEVNGLDFFQKALDDHPDGPLWKIHERWVLSILNAIGDKGNVIIDLINEGNHRTPKEWFERTLDEPRGYFCG